jgi:hypothetical protein
MNIQLYQALLLIRFGLADSTQLEQLICFKSWSQVSQDLQEMMDRVPEIPDDEWQLSVMFSPMRGEGLEHVLELLSRLDFLAHKGAELTIGALSFRVSTEEDFGEWMSDVGIFLQAFSYDIVGSKIEIHRIPGWERA